ncbi:hypothetical protein ACHAXT_003483 [Thalassiosira profunda]
MTSPPAPLGRILQLKRVAKYLVAAAFVVTYLVHHNLARHHLDNGTTVSSDGLIVSTAAGGRTYIRETASDAAWTESHSPYHAMDRDVRISFRLHDPSEVPYPNKFLSVKPYMCGSEKGDLPTSLSGRTVLNFTTTVATDLKIVHLGDSLGQQFVQGFDAAVLGKGYESSRDVLQEYFYEGGVYSHNCLSVAAPIRGGGISSYWRFTNLLSLSNMQKETECKKEELQLKQWAGWSMEQPRALVDHRYVGNATNESSDWWDAKDTFPVGPFDAVVMRIPHGWMDIPDITRERIVEAIELAGESLGVQTVVVTTLPLNNNVLDSSDWQGIARINAMVRDIAQTWKPSPGGGVQWILVQEFGELTNQILWQNARHLGYNTSSFAVKHEDKGWEQSGVDFLLDRLPLAKRKWPPSIPMVCAERPPKTTGKEGKDCKRNRISTDGIHWCIETLGPRYAASIACLLGCVYNGKVVTMKDENDVRECERECNELLMALVPVDERWIGSETTIFSQLPA